MAERVPPGSVLDGEIVAFDGAQTSFTRLQGRSGLHDADAARASGIPVFLYAFDLLVLDGHDVTRLPLRTRKRLLRDAVDFEDPLRMSTHRNTDGEAYLREACERGWEGLVAKRADAPFAGKVGTGFDHRALATLSARFADLAADPFPFADAVREKGRTGFVPCWSRRSASASGPATGGCATPRYLGLRDDKAPDDVTREEPA